MIRLPAFNAAPPGDTRLSRLGEKLCDNLEVLFEDVGSSIRPAVLHGDLWSGNIASVGGQPAIFDPAVYYGHSEAEFGMSWCAGEGRLCGVCRVSQHMAAAGVGLLQWPVRLGGAQRLHLSNCCGAPRQRIGSTDAAQHIMAGS
jgi:hypothetical protein